MTLYLDHAATSPVRPAVLRAVWDFLEQDVGNPSSLHRPGRAARMALEEAREVCAGALGAKVEEILFTSGATESNNLAVLGTMELAPAGSCFLHSAVEHPSVRECGPALEQRGYRCEALPVDRGGVVELRRLEERLGRGDVGLVSVMAVNNEVGTVQPCEWIQGLAARGGVPCHVDAVQAVPGGVPLPRADLVSLSGHKFGGLPGAGLLKVRHTLPLAPRTWGGSQEDSRRAGTQNLPAILALARALQLALNEGVERVRELRDRLEEGLRRAPGAELLAAGSGRAAHISSWLFDGLPAESLLVALDMQGVAASSGSACSSHSIEPSRVLLSMGYTQEQARGLVRLSLGWSTEAAEIDRVVRLLPVLAEELRGRRVPRAAV